jgi:hypothetical protein
MKTTKLSLNKQTVFKFHSSKRSDKKQNGFKCPLGTTQEMTIIVTSF